MWHNALTLWTHDVKRHLKIKSYNHAKIASVAKWRKRKKIERYEKNRKATENDRSVQNWESFEAETKQKL